MTIDIPKLRALLAEATPGPWFAGDRACYGPKIFGTTPRCEGGDHLLSGEGIVLGPPEDDYGDNHEADVALIAAAVNTLPELLDAYERLRAAIERLAKNLECDGCIPDPGCTECGRGAYGPCMSCVATEALGLPVGYYGPQNREALNGE